ncbi:YojF family protein [Evansella tamaricis]|uniref:YojF family protein n=1 Tax=Evansella tamaricis TaxID=2069301 RepID=A0ABS6JAZ8_9BACI|nr:YojF family protein [Evansella tamaricis]MBU9710862.1 YojF family protein [Evansella tamaricis]
MKPIDPQMAQKTLSDLKGKQLYVHLETTNGAYASHRNQSFLSAGTFIRNVQLTFLNGTIKGHGPYRIGMETELGYVYAEGLTDWKINKKGQVLFAGHDKDGKLAIAFQLSETPFPK